MTVKVSIGMGTSIRRRSGRARARARMMIKMIKRMRKRMKLAVRMRLKEKAITMVRANTSTKITIDPVSCSKPLLKVTLFRVVLIPMYAFIIHLASSF